MKDENKEKLIQDALTMLDDELILETDKIREKSIKTTIEHGTTTKSEEDDSKEATQIETRWSRNKKMWRSITAVAASVALFFIAGTVWNEVIVPNQPDQMESIVEESIEDDVMNYADRNQDSDSVTNENVDEMDEVCALPSEEALKESQSQTLQSQSQIHLPNQPIGDMQEALQIDELRKVNEIDDLGSFMEACTQVIQLLYKDVIETVKEAF